jgi:pilus assembly protein CpaB
MNRRVLLVALAVILALAGTVGVYAYVRSADQRAVASGRAVPVVVATKRIAVGTSWKTALHDGSMSVQQMPASNTPSEALRGLDAGVSSDAVAQSEISPGTPVLREVFGPAVAQTGVLAIPKGLIAITVNVGADADVAGYIGPRSEVAVFVTAPLKLKQAIKEPGTIGDVLTITRVVVPRALVIASSQAAPTSLVGSSSDAGAASSGGVLVTLALAQSDAERLVNQQKIGQITLGLLSASSVITQDGGYINAGVFPTTPIWEK